MKRKRKQRNKNVKIGLVVSLLLLLGVVLTAITIQKSEPSSRTDSNYVIKEIDSVIDSSTEQNKDYLKGKKMVSFGDSVTEFGNYPAIVEKNTSMKVQNLGFGGTRIAHHTDPLYDNFSLTKLIESVVNEDFSEQDAAIQNIDNNFSPKFKLHYKEMKDIDFSEVDFVSVFLGTNDYMGTLYGGNVPLGEEDDFTRDTFYGGINVAVETLRDKYPNIEIVFITPTWRINNEQLGGGSSDDVPNGDQTYLIEYVDAIVNRGEKYNIPTLDLYRESDINEGTASKYLADDVHPNEEGFEHLGNLISEFLKDTYNN